MRSTARAQKKNCQKPIAVSAPGITTSLQSGTPGETQANDYGRPIVFNLHSHLTNPRHYAGAFAKRGKETVQRASEAANRRLALLAPSVLSRCSAPRAEPAAGLASIQFVRASLPSPEGHATPQRPVYFLAGAFAFAGAALAFGAAAFFTAGFVAAAAAFAAGFAAAFAAGFAAALAGAAFLAAGFAAALAAGFFAGAAFAAGFAAALAGAAFFTAGFATALAAAGFLAGAAFAAGFAAGFAAAFAGAAFFTAVAAFAATAFAGAFFAGALDAGALDDCLAMSCPFTLCRWP
ncbi:hypothetical protein [Mesorhizobium sp. 113-3-9]|uniref:hypothetical protein n=1 Tax=Mesorhizobium sp. 113-3-9 TaxID=2744517 RepID=UPI001925D0CC|nr:hypothetical protein [Mesorhizobium sp. 113-3-9]